MINKIQKGIILFSKFYEIEQYRFLQVYSFVEKLNEYPSFINLDHAIKNDIVYYFDCEIYKYVVEHLIKENKATCMTLYSIIYMKLILNLPKIIDKIIKKDITIIFCSEFDYDPNKYEDLKKIINARTNKSVERKISTLYRCGNCKNNKCYLTHQQTRSLDEGTSLRIECVYCSNHWFLS